MQWILSASFWSHRWSNWANIGAVVYLAAKRTISVAISARIREEQKSHDLLQAAASIALLLSCHHHLKFTKTSFTSSQQELQERLLEKQTLELLPQQQRGCNMMDIRGSHMLLSRNFTSAQNCGELIHYLVVPFVLPNMILHSKKVTQHVWVQRWPKSGPKKLS